MRPRLCERHTYDQVVREQMQPVPLGGDSEEKRDYVGRQTLPRGMSCVSHRLETQFWRPPRGRQFLPAQSMHAQLLSWIQPYVTPMDYSLPGSSVHGISQAHILEWDAWVDLESVLQGEVSQKEKNKYRILTRICGI